MWSPQPELRLRALHFRLRALHFRLRALSLFLIINVWVTYCNIGSWFFLIMWHRKKTVEKQYYLSILRFLNVSTILLQFWSILFFESWVHFKKPAYSVQTGKSPTWLIDPFPDGGAFGRLLVSVTTRRLLESFSRDILPATCYSFSWVDTEWSRIWTSCHSKLCRLYTP